MDFLNYNFLANSLENWIIAIGVGITVYVILIILKGLVLRHIRKFTESKEAKLVDLLKDLITDLRRLPLILFALYIGSTFLNLQPKISRLIEISVIAIFLFQCGFWGNRIIIFLINRFIQKQELKNGEKKNVPVILQFAGRLLLWSLILLLVMDNIGINVTTLLAGLGIGGIAIALALQNILGDLFASLSILLDKPFEVGDFIIVGDFLGTVEHIGLKTTRIRSLSGEQNIFSNTDLLQSRIRNYRRMSERRVLFTIGVTYQTPAEKLKSIPDLIREAIIAQEKTRFDRANFKEFGDSALIFEVVYYILSQDYNIYMDIQEKINLEIVNSFKENDIEFAYPTRTIFMAKND